MTDHTTHDLAIARAERDAWQSTCEELHRTIAGRDVEIEAHLGRCEAMKRDATVKASQRDTFEHESSRLRAELAAIRDLVAPGNPQGTVVDAVRAMIARWSADERDLRAAIARAEKAEAEIAGALSGLAERLPVTPPTLAAAVDAVREAWDADRSAGARSAAETTTALVTADRELAKLRAEVAELTVTRDRLLAREHEDGRLHAQLRVELAELRAPKKHPSAPDRCPKCEWTNVGLVNFGAPGVPLWLCHGCAARTIAELRARPVLTEDLLRGALDAHGHAALTRKLFAHLGPFTLPSPDRAEELVSAWRGICTDTATCDLDPAERMRRALAFLGAPPTSPPAARPVFAGVSEDELIRLFYVVGTDGIDHGEQCPPIDISDRNGIRAVLARLEVSLVTPVAPTLVAVSDEELATAYSVAHDQPIPRMAPLRDRTIAGIRAVRAKFGAAEVTEERVKAALCEHFKYEGHRDWSAHARAILAYLRATAAKGG